MWSSVKKYFNLKYPKILYIMKIWVLNLEYKQHIAHWFYNLSLKQSVIPFYHTSSFIYNDVYER